MKCQKCGGEIPENSAFCNLCGAEVKKEPANISEKPVIPTSIESAAGKAAETKKEKSVGFRVFVTLGILFFIGLFVYFIVPTNDKTEQSPSTYNGSSYSGSSGSSYSGSSGSSYSGSSGSSYSGSSYSGSSYSGSGTRKQDAWVCAQDVVQGSLKSPSTAKFCSYTDAKITSLGGEKYKIEGYVDAQNGFGATIRTRFTVTLTLTARGYKEGSVKFE